VEKKTNNVTDNHMVEYVMFSVTTISFHIAFPGISLRRNITVIGGAELSPIVDKTCAENL